MKQLTKKTWLVKEENQFLSIQCAYSQKHSGNGKIKGIWTVNCWNFHPIPQTLVSPTFISFHNSMSSWWSELFIKSGSDCSCREVFCRPYGKSPQRQDNSTAAFLK